MVSPELDELREYRDMLLAYSDEELEDVYYHIDILKFPLRYQVLQIEMLRRRLAASEETPRALSADFAGWLSRRPRLARHASLRGVIVAAVLMIVARGATAACLVPVWLFAVPWDFRGVQAAIVYIAYSPIAPTVGFMAGHRIGGRGWYTLSEIAGIVICLWLFNFTGVPGLVVHDLLTAGGGGGGFSFGP